MDALHAEFEDSSHPEKENISLQVYAVFLSALQKITLSIIMDLLYNAEN